MMSEEREKHTIPQDDEGNTDEDVEAHKHAVPKHAVPKDAQGDDDDVEAHKHMIP